MNKLVAIGSVAFSLTVGSAFAAPTTLDYITPFTQSSGLSIFPAVQVGEVFTVPVGVSELNSFSIGFYDASQTPLYGKIQTWNGSSVGTTLFTSSAPVNSPGSSQILGSYFAFTYDLPTALAVTSGQQLFISLFVPTGTFGGNMTLDGGVSYSQGYLLYDSGAGLNRFGNSDTAFSVTFDAAPVPEPETYAMMLAGLGLLGFAARRRKQQAA